MQPYLSQTLRTTGAGFHFTAPPPPGLEHPRYLSSDDPEEVLGCVLLNAQHGRFDATQALLPLLKKERTHRVWSAGVQLLTYASPWTIAQEFLDWTSEAKSSGRRWNGCDVATHVGYLETVPKVVDLIVGFTDEHDQTFLCASLSWLLEAEPGLIFAGPEEAQPSPEATPWDPPPEPDWSAFQRRVRQRAAELLAQQPSGLPLAYAEGEPMHIPSVAERLLQRLGEGACPKSRIDSSVELIAAATGMDIWGAYDERLRVRPLQAAAHLERFLDSDSLGRFEPGRRYFWGHLIPE